MARITKRMKIIGYLLDCGLDISPYLELWDDWLGNGSSVVIDTLTMKSRYGGRDWWLLNKILSEYDCPVLMKKVRDPEAHNMHGPYLASAGRLVWEPKKVFDISP